MASTLEKLAAAELKYDGPIPQEVRDQIFGAGQRTANKEYLKFHRRQLVQAIEASRRYRVLIADNRYDSLSSFERLRMRVGYVHEMVRAATQYLTYLAADQRHNDSLAAE